MITDISTNRKDFITTIINLSNYSSYLELGVDNGRNIVHVATNTKALCVGVDVNEPNSYLGFEFHKMTTSEFFKSNHAKFDVVFIDACHNITSVIEDLENSVRVLNRNGVVLLHDVDPIGKEFIDDGGTNYSANAYKIVNHISTNCPELNVVVLPIDETGIAIVNKKLDRRIYNYMGGA
jgi:hypothetical protein